MTLCKGLGQTIDRERISYSSEHYCRTRAIAYGWLQQPVKKSGKSEKTVETVKLYPAYSLKDVLQ